MTHKQKKLLIRIIVSAVLVTGLAVLNHFLPMTRWLKVLLFLVPYGIIGYDILKKAGRGLLHGRMLDENFLMALASVGALILGECLEGVAVMLFYQVGELFESIAVGKSRKSISQLMDIRPDYANVEQDGKLVSVDPETVPIGHIIVVQPGEKVPIDGVITEGVSALNTGALTGESLPKDVAAGDTALSGSINVSGVLKIQTTKAFGESTASKILDLVENATSRKAHSENFITKFARYYTPIVVGLAAAIGILPPLINLAAGNAGNWSSWIFRALTMLVISCPCAIVISVPLSFFGGIGGASKAGILIKGSNYMETLSEIREVVFDKTGTITRGNFEVTGVHDCVMEEEKLLELAALAESASSHPISKSLQRAYGKELDRSRVTDIREQPGNGVTAKVDGIPVSAGNARFMRQLGIAYKECSSIGTIVHMAVGNSYAGHIVISDELKPHTREAIAALKRAGVRKTVMLTGDTQKVADTVAGEVGIDEVHANLLPGDKVAKVEQLLTENKGKDRLAFVGDGINDAPVLGRADIGIAMGALGSDAAIEAADVVLMDDDPLKISRAIQIARKCLTIVRTNIVFALTVKLICLVIGALGIAGTGAMWIAIFADTGVLILCVLNSIRCLFVK